MIFSLKTHRYVLDTRENVRGRAEKVFHLDLRLKGGATLRSACTSFQKGGSIATEMCARIARGTLQSASAARTLSARLSDDRAATLHSRKRSFSAHLGDDRPVALESCARTWSAHLDHDREGILQGRARVYGILNGAQTYLPIACKYMELWGLQNSNKRPSDLAVDRSSERSNDQAIERWTPHVNYRDRASDRLSDVAIGERSSQSSVTTNATGPTHFLTRWRHCPQAPCETFNVFLTLSVANDHGNKRFSLRNFQSLFFFFCCLSLVPFPSLPLSLSPTLSPPPSRLASRTLYLCPALFLLVFALQLVRFGLCSCLRWCL